MPLDTKRPEVTPQALEVYKVRLAQVDFIKKQQWVVTNYAVLIYAAVAWVYNTLQHISVAFQWLLIEITIAVGTAATVLLLQFQRDLEVSRGLLDKAVGICFSDEQRKALEIKDFHHYSHPFWRGWNVLLPLMSVCIFGAIITIGFLISPHDPKDGKEML